jgi:hypothetical protein
MRKEPKTTFTRKPIQKAPKEQTPLLLQAKKKKSKRSGNRKWITFK